MLSPTGSRAANNHSFRLKDAPAAGRGICIVQQNMAGGIYAAAGGPDTFRPRNLPIYEGAVYSRGVADGPLTARKLPSPVTIHILSAEILHLTLRIVPSAFSYLAGSGSEEKYTGKNHAGKSEMLKNKEGEKAIPPLRPSGLIAGNMRKFISCFLAVLFLMSMPAAGLAAAALPEGILYYRPIISVEPGLTVSPGTELTLTLLPESFPYDPGVDLETDGVHITWYLDLHEGGMIELGQGMSCTTIPMETRFNYQKTP